MMITQVIRIGFFRRLDVILKLTDEEQKRGENQKKAPFQTTNRRRLQNVVITFFEKSKYIHHHNQTNIINIGIVASGVYRGFGRKG